MKTTTNMKCSYCGYKWESRKKAPKSCPRCKQRLDWGSGSSVERVLS